MTRTRYAALGVIAVVLAYVIDRHYLQAQWSIGAPVPVVWWWLGAAVGVLGMPLLLASLGRGVGRLTKYLVSGPWSQLLTTWVLPLLAAHVVWLGIVLAGLRRFNPGFTGIPARGLPEIVPLVLLPPPELSLLWALALAPVVVRLTRRLPVGVVITCLAALTLLTTAPTFLVFLLVGMQLGPAIDRLVETATWRDLVRYGAVALVGASVLGVPRFPDGLGTTVAGLAVLPFVLALVGRREARTAAREARTTEPGTTEVGAGEPVTSYPVTNDAPASRLDRLGTAAAAIYLLQIPVLALFDKVLLARIGQAGAVVQYAVAVAEPVVLTAVVVVCGVVATALVRLATRRRNRGPRRRRAAVPPPLPDLERSPALTEVDR